MTAAYPLVSICIPAFNAEKYLRATIDSVINQTYPVIEIIIVDDGSSDGTVKILQGMVDNRLKYVTHANKGASAARNAALQLCSGDYIKFMDADDLLNPGCIEQQLGRIAGKNNCIASAKWGRFYTEDASDFNLSPETVWKDLPGIDWLVESLIDTGANMMQPGIFLIPRAIIEKAGPWDESLNLIDDFDYMVRVISNSAMVLFCEDAVLKYRSGLSKSLSGSNSALHLDSAFRSLTKGIQQLLATKNDERSRQACADTYQRWSYLFYPFHMELYNKIAVEVVKLGGSNIRIIGSRKFLLLSKIVGWKLAKKLRLLVTGNE